MKELPQQLRHFTSLTSLDLTHCRGLTMLPDWISSMSSLTLLKLCHCRSLSKLPIKRLRQMATLRTLDLSFCANLNGVNTTKHLQVIRTEDQFVGDREVWDSDKGFHARTQFGVA